VDLFTSEQLVPARHHVLLAVTGSIAAFKAAALASEMVKRALEVRVIMTAGATRFVAPLTFEALTGHPVATEVWDEQPGSSRMGHLELARWADLIVVAPVTAAALARLALGLADDLLGAVALATRAPLLLAPAMESAMFSHPATQQHLRTLAERGATVIGPENGRLASGAEGPGRMTEPLDIVERVLAVLGWQSDLSGRRVLVTAGPTHESIDRVRFIGNRSSGKMGFAVAREAAARGAHVELIAGPTALAPPPGTAVTRVESSEEMRSAVLAHAPSTDVVIMAAAVADYRPRAAREGKVRREEGLSLDLAPTEDIAAAAAAAAPHALHVGFALEPENLVESARQKLARKGQNLVVGNLISRTHNPFGADQNQVVFVTPDTVREFPLLSKDEVARLLIDEIVHLLCARERRPGPGARLP
jgi:phosphopantothenoylcysteine decarboxylase/phosphopantothenate--cysteine ligase